MARGYTVIGLHQPKTLPNLGGVLRAAHCYEASLVMYTGNRYQRDPQDVTKAYRHIPLLKVESLIDSIPFDCVPVAVEIADGAKSLVDYCHPRSAFYIFGPEDGSLGSSIFEHCRDVVYVPTVFCMNLAATVNVVLYDRMAKQYRDRIES